MASLFDTFEFRGAAGGPRLLALGAVHGNETCGTVAIRRVLQQLSTGELRLRAGQLTLVPVVNRLAYDHRRRAGDRNLNRDLRHFDHPRDNEDRIANELCPLLASHEVLLDLHSFHSPGAPFVMVGPENNGGALEPFSHSREEEAFARRLGIDRAVDGWLDTYAKGAKRRGGSAAYGVGTTEYMRTRGGWGVTLECGQHDDPRAPEVAYRALMNALAHLRLIDAPDPQPQRMETLRLTDVIDFQDPGDRFVRDWPSFEPLKAGELVGWRADGSEVRVATDSCIVFPNMNAVPGAEWFYLAERSPRMG
ncbi:succinylglutamate desuccinylase/aspartoacylase domain-containing protein [Ramlibacter humi]|uniref:Succinylglutamate desuccinylase n=1 Tax=Ramlibacter humi TaxID=2530451 RepID=A0A4Z0BFR5_9BURK|nr:succinylglutamate desuccinylase/aspartoacylase family protein [Ramlibacter humi]TFY98176.1 succinylglutamate desuccinylase [Ramlibacter humi]